MRRATPEGRAGGSGQGQRGSAGRPGRRAGRRGAELAGTHLRSGSAALLVEQKGCGQQQQPDAEPGPHGGAPGAAATGDWRWGTAVGRSGAAKGGSLSEGRGASAEHCPGRGGLQRRPERGQASSSICWRCPLPSAARGRRLKGEDPAARVRGGGSARPRDCGCRAPGRQGSARRLPRRDPASQRLLAARRTEGERAGPEAGPGKPERADALLVCRGRRF